MFSWRILKGFESVQGFWAFGLEGSGYGMKE